MKILVFGTPGLISRLPGKNLTNITHAHLTLHIKVVCSGYGGKYGPLELQKASFLCCPDAWGIPYIVERCSTYGTNGIMLRGHNSHVSI